MTVNNFLNIPQSVFGLSGIEMGNLIYQTLREKNLKTEYNFGTIIVLDSTDLPISALDVLKDIFDKPPRPIIKEKRDAKGNLQIDLPRQDKPLWEPREDILNLFLKMLMNVHFMK